MHAKCAFDQHQCAEIESRLLMSGNSDARNRAFFMISAPLITPLGLRLNSAACPVPPVDTRSMIMGTWLPSADRIALSCTTCEGRCRVCGASLVEIGSSSVHLPDLPHQVYPRCSCDCSCSVAACADCTCDDCTVRCIDLRGHVCLL